MKKTSFTFAKTFQWRPHGNPLAAVFTLCLLLLGNFAFGQIMDPCPLGSGNTVSGCPAPGPYNVFADNSCNAAIPDFRGGVSGTAGAGFSYIGPVQVPFAGTIVNGAGNYPVQVGAGFVDLNTMTLCAELCPNLTVTVVDNLPPNISCAAPITIDVDANCEFVINSEADVLQFVPSLTDNCTPTNAITLEVDVDNNGSFEPFPITLAGPTCPGPNPLSYTLRIRATDASGNPSSCVSNPMVRDNSGPSVTCNNADSIDVFVDVTCIGTIPNLTGLPTGIVDNCGGPVTFNQSPTPGTIFGLPCSGFDQPVGVVITDCFGNSTTCEYIVVYYDTIAPTINTACGSLPAQPTLVADANCMVTVPDLRPLISASDNCDPGPLAITQTPAPGLLDVSGICPPNNTITVTFEASDCHGNAAIPLVCSNLLTFTDNTAPMIVCPPTPVPVVVPFDNLTCEHGTAMVDLATLIAGGVMVTDNCDPNPTLLSVDPNMFMCADIGKAGLTVTINAQDCFGNPASGVCPVDVQPDIDLTAEWSIPGGDFIVCPSEFPLPIVLGPNTPSCGTWSGDIAVSASNTFTGGFDVANWTIDLAGSTTAEVNTIAAPSSIYMVSSNDGFGPPHITSFSIVVPVSGDYSFNWNYSSANSSPSWDPFGYSINGVYTQLTDDAGSLQQNGTVTVALNAGETFAFEARSVDQCCGAATTNISPIITLDASSFPDLDNDGVPDPGAYSLTYNVGAPGCHVEETHNIMVSPQFNAGDAALVDDFSICLEATEVFDLEGLLDTNSVQGGTFTAASSGNLTGSQIGNLWQYLGGDGQLTVVYTLTDCDNDLEQDTVVISIDEKPDGHFSLPANFCQDEGAAPAIITGVPSGATVEFSSLPTGFITDASTGLFDPTAGPLFGEFADVLVTMQVTNGVCDTFYVSQWIVVYASGDPAFVIPDTICESAAPLNLVLTNPLNDGGVNALLPGNVTWTGTGVTDLGTTGAFDPQDLAPGYYTICVTVGAPSCEEMLCQDIFVAQDYTPAEVALIDDFTLCLLPDDVIDFGSLLAAGALPGGTFTATEQGGLNGNGTINPNSYVYNGECGTLQVVHFFPDDCVPNSDTIVITIEQRPDVGGLAIPGPLCAQDPVAFIEYSGTPVLCGTPGVFSAPLSPAGTITDLGTGTTAIFDPVAAGEGLHIIQYEIGNPVTGCYAILFAEIEVKASSDPDFTVNNVVCANEIVDLALDNADPSVLPTSPDGNTEIVWLGGDGVNAVVTDNGDGTGTFVGYKAGTYTVCVLTGDIGCMAYQCQNITVDVTPPVMNCGPLVRTRNNDTGLCTFTMPGAGFDVTATDNCVPPNGASSLVLTHNYAPHVGTNPNSLAGATFPVGITQVVWTATDTAGNSSNCTIQIEIFDTELPVVQAGGCPANIVQGTDADICGANITYAIPQFSDNCDGVDLEGVLVSGYAPGTDFPVGVTTVTWIYTDLADNGTATCTFTVTVNDDDDPTPVCSPAYAVSLDGDGEFDILATDIDNGSYDNCQIVSTLISRTGGSPWSGSISVSCADVLVSPIVVTLQVVDQAGNSSTCTTEVTVNDDQVPDIECPGDYTVVADPTTCSAVVTYPAPTVTDNCGFTVSQLANFGGPAAGTQEVPSNDSPASGTVSATLDGANNLHLVVWYSNLTTPSVAAHIHNAASGANGPVIVNLAPLGFPIGQTGGMFNATIALDVAQAAEYLAGNLYVNIHTSTYPGGEIRGQLVPQSLNSGDTFPVGTTVQTYQVEDIAGNIETCSFTITVYDEVAPTIDCGPSVRTVSADLDMCSFTVPGTAFDAIGADNCSGVSITHNYPFALDPNTLAGSSFPVGSTTVTWIATDASGNQSAICGIEIIVTDDQDPTIDCGTSGGPANALVNGSFEAGGPFNTQGADGWMQYGPAFRLFASVDPNAFFTHDGDVMMKLFDNNSGLFQDLPVSPGDELSGSLWIRNASFDLISVGREGFLKFEFYDAANNQVGPALESTKLGSTLPIDVWTEVTLNAVVPAGATTVRFVVAQTAPGGPGAVMFDDASLSITSPSSNNNVLANASFEAGGPFNTQGADNWTQFDNVFRLFASVSPDFFTHDGNVMLKLFGPVAGMFQDVPVTPGDELNASLWIRNAAFDPIAVGQEGFIKLEFYDTPGGTLVGILESPHLGSSLPLDVWTETSLSGVVVPAGVTSVRFVAVQVGPGPGAIMFDDASLTIGSGSVAGDVTVSNDPGVCGANINIDNPMADDNCGIVSIINDYNNTSNASDFYPVGTTVVTFTVTDPSGNTAECSISVTVEDNENPVFVNCPTTMVMVGNDPDECSGKINWSIPVATDNCGIDTVFQSGGPMSGSVVPVGMPQTVTYTATDIYGNTNTCVFEVQVVDTQDPEFDADIVMPTDITVECNAIPDTCVFHGNGICTPLINNDVNDNCTAPADLVITFTETSTQGPDPNNCDYYNYTLTRTWTVTDEAGNSTTHVQVITVQDTTPPVPVCQDATVTLDKNGVGTIDPSTLIAGTTDNCAPFSVLDVTASQTSFDCSDLGANNVTLTISDPCLNQATCTIVVTVQEGIGPCAPEATLASSCLNNATTLTNGQFAELITVKSLAMQTWTVASSIGLYTSASSAPPASPINVPVGTALVMGTADGIDNDGDGATDEADEMIYYTLNAKYVEAIGYNATLTNNLGQTLAISNVAHYPTPILANFFDPFCLSTPAFVPEVVDQFAGAGAYVSVTFLLDGQPVTQIDPSVLSVGQHTLVITVDAGTAAFSRRVNGVLVPGDAASSNEARLDPGCVQSITEIFNIVTTPSQVVCNDLLQVTLEDDCSSVISPDMVLEGTYSCFDDYEVHITLPNGIPLNPPNVITGAHVGLTLPYTLWHPISGNMCWGSIQVEDKTAPDATCPAAADIWCTVDPDSIVFYLPPSHPNFPAKDYFGKLVPFNGSLLYLGEPVVTDCSDWSWEYTDDYQVFDCAQNASTALIITRTFVVTDEWGNSDTCHQTITKFRGEASQVTFPADKDISCDNPILATLAPDFDPAVCGWPQISGIDITTTGTGICGLGVTYTDEVVNLCPGSYKVVRTWKIHDWCPENGGAPTQTTYIQYIKVEDVAPVISLPCLQTIDTFHVVHTLGSIYNLNGTNVIVTPTTFFVGQIVETTADYYDEVIDVILIQPSVKVKIERNWTSLGFCSLNASIPGNLPHYPCSTQGPVPFAIIDGGCNNLVEVTVETPAGFTTNGGIIPGDGLPLGLHNITYRAEDECGNITQIVLPILVEDITAPVAVCDEITDVNLSSDGIAEVFATTFDDGSYDGCCLDQLLVRKMVDNCNDGHDDTVFGTSVYFCCEDIANSPITVVFRATDCFGNYNDCMVTVNVSDKLNPYLVECPANERITCDWYADNLETQLALLSGNAQAQSEFLNDHFGQPTFEDNCELDINYQINIALDQCLEGAITRNWVAVDPSGNQSQACNQTIFVDHVSDWVVEFPADITVTCGTGVPDFGEPEIFFETCELVGVSYEDEVFTTVPDACYKLLRTWTIINWCVVGAEIDQEVVESSERAFQLAFPLEPCDFDGDGDCDTRTFRDSWRVNPKSKPSASQATQTTNPDTDLDSDPWDGFITYQQTIKVIDNVDPVFTNGCVIPDVCIEDNTCSAIVVLPEPEITECSPEVTFNVTSDLGTGFGPFSNVAPGTYNVTYNVMDNCNNQTDCHTTVTVKDCKKPTPYCKNGLVIELMVGGAMNGTVELWASDFDAGSFDNCTAQGDLVLSFSSNVNSNNAVYTCDDLGQQVVQLWVTDEAGNQDYCETFVVIQANMGQCTDPGNPLVAGSIQTEELESVADVNVQLSGSAQQSMMTGNDGLFNFSVTPGDDYTVTPVKDDDPLNGVTTLDLVYITKHILGIQLLDSPYKLIAADANKSNSVTTFDLVQLRKLILFIDTTFPNNTSWRFVDKDYVFPDPANPWSEMFPEVINFNNIAASQLAADFVAVKIGDVNGSAVTNFASAGDDRNAVGSLVFALDNAQLNAGDEYTVDFKARDFDVLGYQFTLNFDRSALEFVQVNSAVAGVENFGLTMLENGAITTSWNDNDTRLSDNEVVFSLVFKATANVKLSDALSVNSRYTVAEAYQRNGDLLDVELAFNGSQVASNFELYQNTPNPFTTSTVIGFNLPEASAATLTITDVSGKVVKVLNGDFAKGYNEFRLERRELPATGILYYQLDTRSDSATKMMLLMD